MTRPLARRSLIGLAAAAVSATALTGARTASAGTVRFPDTLRLPDGFQPEGIAIGSHFAYFGSRANGDIYRASLLTGEGQVISKGPGTNSLGLKLDNHGRLFVSGGSAGDARVVDVSTGRILARYQFVTGTSFINDVILTDDTAWYTDSLSPMLFGLPLRRNGALPSQDDVIRLPLTGDWMQQPNVNNANGIARTPDRKALLVVQSGVGGLFRVEPSTGTARRVDIGSASLPNGDGLWLEGRTLYAAQNQQNAIDVMHLDRAGTTGEVVTRITDPRFDICTTIASFGHRLYLPNARFTTPPTPTTQYTAVAINKP